MKRGAGWSADGPTSLIWWVKRGHITGEVAANEHLLEVICVTAEEVAGSQQLRQYRLTLCTRREKAVQILDSEYGAGFEGGLTTRCRGS